MKGSGRCLGRGFSGRLCAHFERLTGKFELYKLLGEGMEALTDDRTLPAEDVFFRIEQELEEGFGRPAG